MNAVVFEHVPVAELPEPWRARVAREGNPATVTVRIEHDPRDGAAALAEDPLFGMWRDREDMVDVAGWVRRARASRFDAEPGSADAP